MNKYKIYKKGGGWVLTLLLLLFSVASQAKEIPLVNIEQSAQQVWQRQQVLITAHVSTKDSFSRLDADDFQRKGWSISAFPMQRIEGETETKLILKWAVFPFMAGKQIIKLPEIIYRPNRGRKQVLPTQDINIQVRSLPIYVSPTMPVGEIKLQSLWNNGLIINTHNLTEWQVHVIGNNVVKQTMPPIKRQIESNESLQILPIRSTTKVLKTELGIINYRDYIIPLKARENGKLKLPEIEVQYFDPKSGKLQKSKLSPPFVISLDHVLFGLLLLLSIFLILYVFFKLLLLITDFVKEYSRLKRAVGLLERAKNYPQLRSAINQLSIVEGWEANFPLSKFLQKWENKFGKSTELEEKVSRLQVQFFSVQDERI